MSWNAWKINVSDGQFDKNMTERRNKLKEDYLKLNLGEHLQKMSVLPSVREVLLRH